MNIGFDLAWSRPRHAKGAVQFGLVDFHWRNDESFPQSETCLAAIFGRMGFDEIQLALEKLIAGDAQ